MDATAQASEPKDWRELVPDHIRKDIGLAAYKVALNFWRNGDPELQKKAMQLLAEYKQRKAARERGE